MFIINPETGRKVKITSKKGSEVYIKYYKNTMTGGSECKDFDKELENYNEIISLRTKCKSKDRSWKQLKKKYECDYKVTNGQREVKYRTIEDRNIPGTTKRGNKTDLRGCQTSPGLDYTIPDDGSVASAIRDNALDDCKQECFESPDCEAIVFHKWGAMLKNGNYDIDNDLERREGFTIYEKYRPLVKFYDEYEGSLYNDKRHGKGTMIYSPRKGDKVRYVGNWNEDLRHGRGVMEYITGSYDGYWQFDKKHGTGSWKSSKKNCSISNGLWKNNKFIGTYNGDINKEGVPHGLGELKFKDKRLGIYYGNFENYEIVGKGKLTKQNSTLEGTWINNKMNGLGKHTKSFGIDETEIYEGPFIDNKYHGEKGKYTYLDGSQYLGSWVSGQKNGPGILNFSDKNKYVGYWKNDEFHGKGTFHLGNPKNPITYKGYLSGIWKNGWLKQGEWHVKPLGKWLVLKHIDTNITFAINPHYTQDEIDRVYQFSCLDYLECPGFDSLDLGVYFRVEPSSYMLGRDENLVFTTQQSKKIIVKFGPSILKYNIKLSPIISDLNSTLVSLYGYGYKIINI